MVGPIRSRKDFFFALALAAVGILAFVLFFGFARPARAADPWSKQDIALETLWEGIHLMDWSQTRQIATQPDRYFERNPILGQHPSKQYVNVYMLSGAVLHPVVTNFLPKKYRPYFQGISIAMSGTCVVNNFSIGLGLKW
jgi:hypothetical protein